ncbi:hypothetical protein P7K49_034105 [Saguinus oedipus]|uniref:Uncharacterized protein n=1 Tax=Saguinus oedipus TaxID=9490 RepID=A0ABQ9TTS8_SAGOE|nr:hypothetical protein P7K49_034105 [Saguinus oedipus]
MKEESQGHRRREQRGVSRSGVGGTSDVESSDPLPTLHRLERLIGDTFPGRVGTDSEKDRTHTLLCQPLSHPHKCLQNASWGLGASPVSLRRAEAAPRTLYAFYTAAGTDVPRSPEPEPGIGRRTGLLASSQGLTPPPEPMAAPALVSGGFYSPR